MLKSTSLYIYVSRYLPHPSIRLTHENVWFEEKLHPMCLLLLLDNTQSMLRKNSERRESINYFSLADKSFPDLLCSTFFLSNETLKRA